MREIKFRGFDPITKKFIYGNLLFTNETYYIIPFLTNGCMSQKEMMLRWVSPCYQVIPETVDQFTGLHDKNGLEIYKNDICLVSCKYFNIENEKSTVIFKDGCFCFQYGCTDDYVKTYNAWDLNSIEVIGNIHERSKQDEEVK